MKEDPLFDPWGSGAAPAEPEGTVEPQGPETDRDEEPSEVASLRVSRWRSPESGAAVPRTRPPLRRASDVDPDVGPAVDPTAPASSRESSLLRDVVLPRIRDLSRRLESFRHTPLVDDRSGRDPASVRFRIRPWTGPFDDAPKAGPALELVLVNEGEAPSAWDDPEVPTPKVSARLWLDPAATGPAECVDIPVTSFTDRRLDELLLEYVRVALSSR